MSVKLSVYLPYRIVHVVQLSALTQHTLPVMGKRKGKGRQQGVQKHRTNQKAENVTLVKEKPSGHHFPVPVCSIELV